MRFNPQTVDEYLIAFPTEVQQILQEVRKRIRQTVPEAEECISYGIPCYKLKNKIGKIKSIFFAGFKNHISIYPAPRDADEFMDELSTYKGGKGTVQFSLEKDIPYDLIQRIVIYKLDLKK